MPDIRIEKQKASPTIKEQRIDACDGIFQLVGLGCIMVGWYSDAGAIDMHGHGVSIEVSELAEQNKGVAKGTDALLQIGPYAGIVAALMPLVVQLAVNHKAVDATKLPANANVVPPDVLTARVQTAMKQQAIAAMKAQIEAEEELRRMETEFNEYVEQRQNGQSEE